MHFTVVLICFLHRFFVAGARRRCRRPWTVYVFYEHVEISSKGLPGSIIILLRRSICEKERVRGSECIFFSLFFFKIQTTGKLSRSNKKCDSQASRMATAPWSRFLQTANRLVATLDIRDDEGNMCVSLSWISSPFPRSIWIC